MRERRLIDIFQRGKLLDEKGIRFIYKKDQQEFLSYRNLYQNSLQILANLQRIGIQPGQELIFQLDDNQEFLLVFWACILGGIIPVPVSIGNNAEHRLKLIKIWNVLNQPYLITSEQRSDKIDNYVDLTDDTAIVAEMNQRTILFRDIWDGKDGEVGVVYDSRPEDIAFIQFSSGSTGNPKGVILTHENLLTNIAGMIQAFQSTPDDSYLGWMPLTHDMGLIGWHLTPMFVTCTQNIIPTSLFIRSPYLWLQATHDHRATILASPNFGYKHFLKRFSGNDDWDLSHVRLITNGAEPISVELCHEFLEALAPNGLKRQTMFPAYGMAEACLGVTTPPIHEELKYRVLDRNHVTIGEKVRDLEPEDANGIIFVDEGYPLAGTFVRVCDDEDNQMAEDVVGYVQIRGGNVTQGYYNNPEATAAAIREDGWLNTGDLGFMNQGRLTITGRAKDIIFVNGQNYYPHDIESVAEEVPEVELNKIAICGVMDEQDQTEKIITFVLYRKSLDKFILLAQEIKSVVSRKMGLDLAEVIPVSRIPKTTSGKLQRYKLADEYRRGDYDQLLREMHLLMEEALDQKSVELPQTEIEKRLLDFCLEILAVKKLGVTDQLLEAGLNSLRAVALIGEIQKAFQVELPVSDIFTYSTIRELAGYIEQAEKSTYTPIDLVAEGEVYPASSVQRRLVALREIAGNEVSYNLPFGFVMEGELDRQRLDESVYQLVQRHESLRTSFEVTDGEIVQRIHDEVDFTVQHVVATEEELDLLVQEFVRPFDLGQAPLLRVKLVELLPTKHLFLFDMHHSISDGSSLGIFVQELLDLYAGKELPKLRVQYKDFTAWQNQLLASEKYQQQEKYWLDQFADEVPVLNMPTDFPRPSEMRYSGDVVKFTLPAELTTELREMSMQQGATLYMSLLAGYYLVLAKYAGQEDLVIGSAVAGRTHPDVSQLIGMFVNTLARRALVDGEKSFTEFLTEIQESSWAAFDNQDYPFELLVDRLGVQRTLSRNPIFDMMFVLQNNNFAEIQVEGLRLIPYELEQYSAKFDMTLHAFEVEDRLNFELEYSTELFKRETVEQFAGHYLKILQQMAQNPEVQVGQIEMVTDAEKDRLLVEFNNTVVDYPREKTIHQLFEEQVERSPEKVAAVFADQQLTYRELNARANQLARVLRSKGIKPDQVVGVMVERSLEMLIGVLGIIKAGGAYLPIDMDYPEERIKYMLEDAEVQILLTQGFTPSYFSGEWINLEDQNLYSGDSTNPELINQSSDLIYIIYTSGSTGQPKGVMIEHMNVNRLIMNSNMLIISEDERIMQTGSLAFDASTFEIWGSLLNGATLYLVDHNELLSPRRFEERMKEYGITMIWLTAPLFNQLLEENPEIFSELQTLLVGGDALSSRHINLVREKFSDLKVLNGYGPTESTTFTTYYQIEENFEQNIPIGQPVSNTQVYILDSYQNLQPVGAIGELCIGGDGLARGYLRQPELTEANFVENPFRPDERMYRTGDLARWLPDGNIDFIGRMDHQVKIRGFRIELGEIESQILQMEGMKEAVVIDRQDESGHKYLCCYLVARQEFTILEVREYLKERLPDYMIPSYFVQMVKLPLTSNGKLNRRALPEPAELGLAGREYVEPTTPLEKEMASIWEEVLGVQQVGMNDHFFELGGHSLKATFLASKIYKYLNVEVAVRDIFTHPGIGDLVQYIAATEERNYLAIEPVEEREFYPVSSAQKRLFIINKREKSNITYNVPFVKVWKGQVDEERLEGVIQALIQRHEALRTSFVYRNEEPVQRIQKEMEFKVQYFTGAREDWPQIIKEFVQPFDLGKAPLFRVGLVKGTGDEHLFIFDIHHIIADGVALGVLIQEFVQFYEGESLPEQGIQYKDFTIWQNARLRSDELQSQEEYWLNRFADEIPVMNMPTDYPRPVVKSYRGDSLYFDLDQQLTDQLKRLGMQEGATLYMVLLAAYNLLFAKYSGDEDLVIGSAIAGRPHADLEKLVGVFINSLAMRNAPQGDQSFVAFLGAVKENALRAYENSDYQFDMLVEKLDLQRDSSRSPLYDHMFGLQNMDSLDLVAEEFRFLSYGFEYKISKFDSILLGEEVDGEIRFRLEYSEDLFKRETMERFAQHYVYLLGQVVEHPEARLADFSLLNPREKEHLLVEWNQTEGRYPADQTIQQLFETQVAKRPDALALVYEGEELTYRELNERANQLARVLRQKGLQPDQIVALLVERSLDQYIGVLGILKAGGAYLSIDLEYPKGRIEFMLEDSQARLLLTRRDQLSDIEFAGEVIEISEEIYTGDGSNLEHVNRADDLAYIIYTSGSTGKPKGVMLEHRGVSNLHQFFVDTLGVTSEDRIIQFASCAFDASVWESYMALLAGATLYPVPKDVINSYSAFENFLNEQQITLCTLPPVYLTHLDPEKIATLRKVITAGSATNFDLVNRWKEKVEYVNAYGPTETTVCTTIWQSQDGDYKSVPIGQPILNTQVYILNDRDQLLPIGVIGELCVAGVSLARGYLNRPELTAEKFVDNPFVPGEKMYRTGDLARWLADGTIEFLGRIDHQVKIRGFRIELGEIESELLSYSGVQEVVVIDRIDSMGDPYLAAYWVADLEEQEQIEVADLKEYLAAELPDYMIPAYFVQLDQIPLTQNDKVDRSALPDPEKLEREESTDAPRNQTEAKMLEIWEEVLGRDEIGIHDNFFELGGHSLKATQLGAVVYREMNVEISLMEVFERPTIAELADYIGGADAGDYQAILPVEEREYYPLSSAQKRLFALRQIEGSSIVYNMPGFWKIEGALDQERLKEVLSQLVQRHEAFRTSFELVDGEAVQRIHPEVEFTIVAREVAEAELPQVVREFIQPFDLEMAPLFRVGLFQYDTEKYLFALDQHHIISDGVSLHLFFSELARLYDGEELPELEIQYKDFAVWQRNFVETEEMQEQEAYWLNLLQGEIPVLNLPTDYPRPTVMSTEGDRMTFEIDRELAASLYELASSADVTLYMLLLAAFNLLLAKYTGQDDLIVGSPVAGRPHADLEDVMGMFVNTLAMRNQPKSSKQFSQFVQEVRTNTLDAFANQDYQFEMLVEKLELQRDLGRNPLFDVMFALQNANQIDLEMGGLKLVPENFEFKISKFDLTMNALERNDAIFCILEYCSALFSIETMERFSRHFVELLRGIVSNPEATLAELVILSEEEREQVLFQWNQTDLPFPTDQTIVQLFAENAIQTPDQVALLMDDQQMTYGELDQKTNQLARLLREQGIRAGQVVALMVERSFEMAIGILAILKAGGAYLPIDPSYPLERIEYMLEDSQAKLLLTQGRLISEAEQKLHQLEMLDLNDASLFAGSAEALERVSKVEDLAYVIYTSGSTGQPKGVMVEHGSVFNTIYWRKEEYQMRPEARALQLFSYSFDGFITSFFTPLVSGAQVVLLSEQNAKDAVAIQKTIREKEITHLLCVPSLYSVIVETLTPEDVLSLQVVTLAGEQVTRKLIQGSKRLNPEIELINEYGPTENSVATTIQRNLSQDQDVTIGSPIANVQVYILDANLQPFPTGVPGELCISGASLARGYLNQPELTAEKFVNNPFVPGMRMYRTGDRAKWLEKGQLAFLGRVDDQVKIRGYRIEPGEIEKVLTGLQITTAGEVREIRDAVVLAKKDQQGRSYLAAYLVATGEVTIGEIRERLLTELPEYMVPTHYAFLEQMPLMSAGKVDRHALMEMECFARVESEFVEPTTEVQEVMAQIWSEVLGVEKIGIRDSYFELGGDSIQAIQIVARLKSQGVHSKVQDLFQYRTIEQVALHISREEKQIRAEQGLVTGEVPFTAIIQRFFTEKFANPDHWNQSVTLELDPTIQVDALEKAMGHWLSQHDALRLRLTDDRRLIHANDQLDEPLKLVHYDLTGLTPVEQDAKMGVLGEEFKASLDLEGKCWIQGAIFDLGERGRRLLITCHHLAVDGVSWRILLEDLTSSYQQIVADEEVTLPPKTTSFKEWAEEIQEYSRSEALLQELPYWENTLEHYWKFPAQRVAATEDTLKERITLRSELEVAETEQLLTEVHGAYNTEVQELMLLGLARAVKNWVGKDHLLVHLEGHGRQEISGDIDVSRTVGWFTSLYPVALDLATAQTLDEEIKLVKEQLRQIPNKGLGYGILKYVSQQITDDQIEEHNVTFNYLGQFSNDNSGLFKLSQADTGSDIDLTNHATSLLNVTSMVVDDQLQILFSFNGKRFPESVIQELLDTYLAELRQIISHCLGDDAGGLTPSDFDLIDVDQSFLDDLMEDLA